MANGHKRWKWAVALGALLVLAVAYTWLDPLDYAIFPKCPVKMLTGLDCPGCGSQRAIHALLNGQVAEAFRCNALMVLAIPYVLAGFAFDLVHTPGERLLKWRKRLFGETAIYMIIGIITAFTVLRNVL